MRHTRHLSRRRVIRIRLIGHRTPEKVSRDPQAYIVQRRGVRLRRIGSLVRFDPFSDLIKLLPALGGLAGLDLPTTVCFVLDLSRSGLSDLTVVTPPPRPK